MFIDESVQKTWAEKHSPYFYDGRFVARYIRHCPTAALWVKKVAWGQKDAIF